MFIEANSLEEYRVYVERFKCNGRYIPVYGHANYNNDFLLYSEEYIKYSSRTVVFMNRKYEVFKGIFEVLIENPKFELWEIFRDKQDNLYMNNICFVGIYSEFVPEIYNVIKHNKELKYDVLMGRDIKSLSWIIAKQFLKCRCENNLIIVGNNILFEEYLTLKRLEDNKTKVITASEIAEINMHQELLEKCYKTIIFWGHGKDDHINMCDYTLCGRKQNLKKNNNRNMPYCGYTGKCFKDNNKIIFASELKAENVILASCHSGAIQGANNYIEEYNLSMACVDSLAKNIIYSTSVTRFGIREMLEIIKDKNFCKDIKYVINNMLNDSMAEQSFEIIGLSHNCYELNLTSKKHDNRGNTTTYKEWEKYIEKLNVFINTNVFAEERELLEDCQKILRYGVVYSTKNKRCLDDSRKKYEKFREKILSFQNHLVENINKNYFLLGDMSSWIVESMDVGKCIYMSRCNCGNIVKYHNIDNKFIPNVKIKELFCPSCGDKGFILGNSLKKFEFRYLVKDENCLMGEMNFKVNEDCLVHCGIIFPNYLKEYIISNNTTSAFYMKSQTEKKLLINVQFKDNILSQKHYFGIYVIYDLNIIYLKMPFEISKI